mmetsp:Transcript_24581/g.79035  ORF Transcript_24581/g.79035 Transcript_24581/m.79035 type:complete len:258 (+) Transcript_24581:74-847(+)
MLAILSPQAFVAPTSSAALTSFRASAITMQQTYADYLAARNGVAVSPPVSLPQPSFTFEDYLARRHDSATDVAPAEEAPAPAAEHSFYADYLATRDAAEAVEAVIDSAPVEAPAPTPAAAAPESFYADYLATRNAAAKVAEPAPAAPTSFYQEYLASRDSPPLAVDAALLVAPAPAPVEAAPASPYAEYLATRDAAEAAKAPAAAAAPAVLAPKPVVAAVRQGQPGKPGAYDPWSDDTKTLVTFEVDGVPKQYRIKQ